MSIVSVVSNVSQRGGLEEDCDRGGQGRAADDGCEVARSMSVSILPALLLIIAGPVAVAEVAAVAVCKRVAAAISCLARLARVGCWAMRLAGVK